MTDAAGQPRRLLKVAGLIAGLQGKAGWPGRWLIHFHHFLFCPLQGSEPPWFGISHILIWRSIPSIGVLGAHFREREADNSKAHVLVTPVGLLSLVPGGMPGVSRQDQSGCPAACPSAQPTEPPFPWLLGKKYPLYEEQFLHKSLFAKASWPFLAPTGCNPFWTEEEGGPQIPPPFLHGHSFISQMLKSCLYLGKRNSNRRADAGTQRVSLKD